MVRDGEHLGEEGPAQLLQIVQFLQGLLEYVLVADAPGIRERGMRVVRRFDELVESVGHGESAHAIERAATAVEKQVAIATLRQYSRQRVDTIVMIAFQNGLGRDRRQRRESRLDRSRAPIARRIKV